MQVIAEKAIKAKLHNELARKCVAMQTKTLPNSLQTRCKDNRR